ncbi:MAG TPA: phospho-N-acetylmuramoyl-pentapeptide-transferase [Saprospiraceae bacterium]|jgi:phospho-N-acetylmuramoyl-pentapeptide-transferase|nr:phospho-N-acetylmuramoyl-pentapeptide-transferase [Candidatus Parvibacillus calidus]MBX2935654.1 phospho-N-acetylmuramoyl-pentapeptide-transferase [Saprospiraceae bacterium]MBX7178687.1 phospho-N-acetylmuramoyl-pentapeptide-transferase [Saprospiraceae bacterium]MCB0591747.1 phospho-N-acetylmuramoyl-pentapeptide-transferase [Saprospiraceae bacterium]MCC7148533.1 phospho-N-acetylmuramoyl-pentapeptide-transferase [Saprospiraceae bacterium]
MLYYLFEYLYKDLNIPGTGVFRFITFRAGLAIVLSLLISIVFGKRIIQSLRRRQIGETVRDLGLEGQKEKEGTPTMGGIIIVLAIVVPCLLVARLDNVYIILMLISTLWMASIGYLDDYIKVVKKDKDGLKGVFKIIGQVGLGLLVAITMLMSNDVTVRMTPQEAEQGEYKIVKTVMVEDPHNAGKLVEMVHAKAAITNVPFFKNNELDYGRLLDFMHMNKEVMLWIVFIVAVVFIITAVSNAANLTDGIDGLATGVSATIGAVLAAFAYLSGNSVFADYLNITFIPNSSELVIFSSCFIGACTGFLWHNSFPARVFMGDTGSLTLGGIIAALAIVLRKELLLPILCGIFVVENLSVIIQRYYFKYTKKKYGEGRRVFLMAPIHHHFQKKGYHEAKIVTRFWIVSIILAVMTILTLKIR